MEELRRFDEGFDGALGVAAIDLTTGRMLALHGDTLFPQASVIKIPILARMFQAARAGTFSLDDRVTIEPRDAVGGSGHLQERLKNGPVTLAWRELITAMIEYSDNTATNKCIQMAGMDGVNRMMDELGLRHTRPRRKMMDSAAVARGDENLSTPEEMARLVEMVYRGKLVDEAASKEILEIMKKVSGGIPRRAAFGCRDRFEDRGTAGRAERNGDRVSEGTAFRAERDVGIYRRSPLAGAGSDADCVRVFREAGRSKCVGGTG